MFKQSKLTTAMAVAIGTSAVFAAGTATAATALFPHIVVSPTVTTIVSVMNDGEPMETANDDYVLHYTYLYKEIVAGNAFENNTKECTERNWYLPSSQFDIQTFDPSGRNFGVLTKGVMFDDPSINNDWESTSRDWQFGRTPEVHRAVLLVDNEVKGGIVDSKGDGAITGEAMVLEVVNGAGWGYQALANKKGFDFTAFNSSNDNQGIAFMPPDEVNTRFLVTPTDAEVDKFYAGNYKAWIGVRQDDPTNPDVVRSVRGVFDRDENILSGGLDRPVVCVGAWAIEDLYPDAVALTPGGGWTYMVNYRADPANPPAPCNATNGPTSCTLDEDPAAIIFKLEFGVVSSLDGGPGGLPDVYNNALYLHPDVKPLTTPDQ